MKRISACGLLVLWAWGVTALLASCGGEDPVGATGLAVDTLTTSTTNGAPDADTLAADTVTADTIAADTIAADTVSADTLTAPDPPELPTLTGTIAFSGDRVGSPTPYVYVASADGSNIRPLTGGRMPSWSPDGAKLAFVRWSDDVDHRAGIYVVDADGSNETRLVDGGYPAWSPDGSQIVFSGPGGIRIMNADGTDVSQLLRQEDYWEPDTYGWAEIADLAWSPDGEQIVFTRGGDLEWRLEQLYVMNADGSDVRLLTSPSPCGRSGAAWSPDGAEIAFTSCGSVVVARADGSEGHRLADGAFPAWSPDGRYVAFALRSDWYVVDRDGGPGYLLIPNGAATGSGPLAWTATEVKSHAQH